MVEANQVINLARHCLHLCNSSNIEETAFYYLVNADTFVTNNSESWKKRFEENNVRCKIKKPNEVIPSERIVVDGSSLGKDLKKWEGRWKNQSKTVCIYNIDELSPSMLKDLVNCHDKMLLSINKMRMFSDKNLDKEIDSDLDPEIVESIVKRELKSVLVSLLLSKPMCGTELVKILYEKFRVLVSPGMLYPALRELEKNGLLKYDYQLKTKIYTVQKKEQAKLLLNNHVKASSLLSQFLVGD